MSYDAVEKELASGTPPEMLCATCPWDRLCIKPPAMSKADVEKRVDEAKARDMRQDPEGKEMPMGTLLATIVYAGRSSQGEMCPVFALRMRSPEGRKLADTIRSSMQQWDDNTEGR